MLEFEFRRFLGGKVDGTGEPVAEERTVTGYTGIGVAISISEQLLPGLSMQRSAGTGTSVQVNDLPDATISGSGSIYYSVSPQVNVHVSGSGKVTHL